MIGAAAMVADLFLLAALVRLAAPWADRRMARFMSRLMSRLLENIASKLDRPERAAATLRARSLMVGLTPLAIGAITGRLIEFTAEATQYGWGIEILVLALLLGQRNMWGALKAGRLAGVGDPHLPRRRAVSELANLAGQRLIGVLVWYWLFGLTGALVYQVALTLPSLGRSKPFRGPLITLKRMALLPPSAVAGLILPIGCLVAPRGAPIVALKSLMVSAPEVMARGLVAGGLNLSLDSPDGWIGPDSGRAKLEAGDVYAAAILYAAVWVTMLAICLLVAAGLRQ